MHEESVRRRDARGGGASKDRGKTRLDIVASSPHSILRPDERETRSAQASEPPVTKAERGLDTRPINENFVRGENLRTCCCLPENKHLENASCSWYHARKRSSSATSVKRVQATFQSLKFSLPPPHQPPIQH